MVSEWVIKPLGDLIALQRGHDLPSQNRVDGSVPIMGSAGITGYHNEVKTAGPGIVIGRSGNSMGEISFSPVDYWPLNTCLYVTDFKGNDSLYIYYFLKTIDFDQFNSGSAQKSLNRNAVYPFQVFVTEDKAEQRRIGRALADLDDKIELNRQTNQTLESMAQALFKSWFVDFDPVIDNALAAGNAIPEPLQARAEQRKALQCSSDALDGQAVPQLPEAIRQLFPNSFVLDAEMGWIPKGWESTSVGQTFDVTMGQSPPGSTYNEEGEGLPFFQGKTDFGFRYPTNRIFCTAPKRFAYKGQTLVSVRAPVGDANMAAADCCIGRGIAAAKHKSGSESFTYYAILQMAPLFETFNGEGTVFGSINQKDFKALPHVEPIAEAVKAFDDFAKSLDRRIEMATLNISNLTNLRDTLLPKLISGELRIPEATQAAQELEATTA